MPVAGEVTEASRFGAPLRPEEPQPPIAPATGADPTSAAIAASPLALLLGVKPT